MQGWIQYLEEINIKEDIIINMNEIMKSPEMRSPDHHGRRDKPWYNPTRQGNNSQVIPPAEGKLKSLAMYCTIYNPHCEYIITI